MEVSAEGSVFLIDSADLIVDHELLVEAVAFRRFVVRVHEVVDSDGLGAVLFADPVSVREVDTDRRSGITIAGKDSGGDDLGGHTFDLLFFVFGVGRGVVLKPLCVVGDELGTFGSREVFEVDHRLPGAGDAERVGIGLREAVDVVHAAVEVLDPGDAVLVEGREVTCLVEGDHLLDGEFLGIVFSVFERLFEPEDDMLEGFGIEPADFIDALLDLAVVVLHELGVQTDPFRFGAVIFVESVPFLRLRLCDAFAVVVAGGAENQIHTVLRGRALRHDSRIEHHRDDLLVIGDTGLATGVDEPLLGELRQELILGIMMVDTVGEPHALEVTLEGGELVRVLVIRIVEVERLQRTTDTKVVTAVLVKEDVASPEGRLG